MKTVTGHFTNDHRQCDEIYYALEQAASRGDWEEAQARFNAFQAAVEHHFELEEAVMFPAFEEATGSTQGPTHVMRMEHAEMRDLLRDMEEAVRACDSDEYAGLSETLNILMQQHNMKEENILYPMVDRVVGVGMLAELKVA